MPDLDLLDPAERVERGHVDLAGGLQYLLTGPVGPRSDVELQQQRGDREVDDRDQRGPPRCGNQQDHQQRKDRDQVGGGADGGLDGL